MLQKKYSTILLNNRCGLSIFLISFFILSNALVAKSNDLRQMNHSNSKINRIQFIRANEDRPDSRGTPPTTHGVGSRGDCPETQIPLTRLVGSKDLDLTVLPYPTIWVYMPYTSAQIPSGQFNFYLQNKEENTLYQTSLLLPIQPGVIAIHLPQAQVNPLNINEKYRWYVTVDCSQNDLEQDGDLAFVTGQIKRIPLTKKLEQQLESKTLLERVQLYAKNGIWYETLTELAQQQMNEQKLLAIWRNLLTSVGLEDISQEPILKNAPESTTESSREEF